MYEISQEQISNIPDNPHIQGAFFKAIGNLDQHKKMVVSVSEGSDSDIVVDFMHQCGMSHKVDYVFFDTGIEYQATYDHLDYLEDRYGIYIQRERAYKSIPMCCKEYGVPFMSKYTSEMIKRMQDAGFQFEDGSYSDLSRDYPDLKSGLRWWCNEYPGNSLFNINRKRLLKEFLMEHPPKYKISNKCCHYSKKITAHQYNVKNDIDVVIIGLRKSEGGIRGAIKQCYVPKSGNMPDKYYPIFWLTDSDKTVYNKFYKIKNSDCYSKYGLNRTGCVCCPYGLECGREREAARIYEPKLYRLTERVFGKSYDYTRFFYEFRGKHDIEVKRGNTKLLDCWL